MRVLRGARDCLWSLEAKWSRGAAASPLRCRPSPPEDRTHFETKQWWGTYGVHTPELKDLALKLLGQPASSSCCERNWSTYAFIHSMKRNKLTPERAEDLVFVHNNLRLLSRKSNDYQSGPSRMWDVGGDGTESFVGVGF